VIADPFTADVRIALLLKLETGEPLTAEEQAEWDAYQAALIESEARRGLLGLVDLGEVMREGVEPCELLTEHPPLVKGQHHLWFGTKESSKTWLLLIAAAKVLRAGGTVLWIDKEMGRALLAERLLTLRVPDEVVEERFIYCEFPTLDRSRESVALFQALIQTRKPTLMVIDAQTEVLADADLNENSGTDIEKWSKDYLAPARRIEATTVMLDHTGHEEADRAVSSRQKGAAAKVEYAVRKTRDFDRSTVGTVTIYRKKNTAAADIPEVQSYRIGGSPFTFEQVEQLTRIAEDTARQDSGDDPKAQILRRVAEYVRDHAGDEGLTTTAIRKEVGGMSASVTEALKTLVDAGPVTTRNGPTGKPRYFWNGTADVGAPTRPMDVPDNF
jgi:AAA domain